MTTPSVPEVECDQLHAGLAVPDVQAAAEFYATKLGFRVAFSWGEPPVIAGLTLGNVQIFLEKGEPNPVGCAVYFVVGNADELYEFQRARGAMIVQPPEDRDYGLRTYRVRDLHGTSWSSVITCSTPARRSQSSASRFGSGSKNGSRRCCTIWPTTSA